MEIAWRKSASNMKKEKNTAKLLTAPCHHHQILFPSPHPFHLPCHHGSYFRSAFCLLWQGYCCFSGGRTRTHSSTTETGCWWLIFFSVVASRIPSSPLQPLHHYTLIQNMHFIAIFIGPGENSGCNTEVPDRKGVAPRTAATLYAFWCIGVCVHILAFQWNGGQCV